MLATRISHNLVPTINVLIYLKNLHVLDIYVHFKPFSDEMKYTKYDTNIWPCMKNAWNDTILNQIGRKIPNENFPIILYHLKCYVITETPKLPSYDRKMFFFIPIPISLNARP